MTDAIFPVENHLRHLYGSHQNYSCFEGPYEACEHLPDRDGSYEEHLDNSDWEGRSIKDELDDDELEEDELEGDELEGDELERDELEGDELEGHELEGHDLGECEKKDKRELINNAKGQE